MPARTYNQLAVYKHLESNFKLKSLHSVASDSGSDHLVALFFHGRGNFVLKLFSGGQRIHVSTAAASGDLGPEGPQFKGFFAEVDQGFMGKIHVD